MNWIDIILTLIIVWFAFKGYRKGFVVELTTLISLIVAIIGAIKYKSVIENLLSQHLDLEGAYVPFLAFVITFLVLLIIVSFIGKLITKIIKIAQLGLLNRLLGALFAITKIAIILSLIVNGVDRINNETHLIKKETTQSSILYNSLNNFAEKVYSFSEKHYDKVKKEIDKTLENKTTI